VIGLAAGVALALLGLRLRHRLDVSAEILPSHHLLDRLQRIALGADRLQPTLNIEKPLLPMTRSLHPPTSACAHRVRFVGTWREEFFEAPWRQDLFFVRGFLRGFRRGAWAAPIPIACFCLSAETAVSKASFRQPGKLR